MFEKLLKWIRSLLGQVFGQSPDADIVLSDKMTSAIALWVRMYEDGGPWCGGKTGIHSLKLPAAIASEFARLITVELAVTLSGSARASYLQEQVDRLLDDFHTPVEFGCAFGGIVFKPYVSGDKLIVDTVQADAFFPTTFDTSRRLVGAIFVEQIKRGGVIYTRAEHHEYADGVNKIDNKAFASRSSYSIGTPIDLASVPEWADIEPTAVIEGVDRPLFAYFRIPQANRQDRQSPLGSSVYAEAAETIRDADEQYGRLMWEYNGGQLAVDVAEDLLNHYSDGSVSVPQMQKRLYRGRSVQQKDQAFYKEFAPQLRDESYRKGLDTILKRIEFQVGLSYGTLSDPQSVDKTATEIKASKQRSYSVVSGMQRALQNALDDLLYAMDKLATLYALTQPGVYEVAYMWGDGILEDVDAEYARRKGQVDDNLLRPEKFISWYYRVSEKEALKYMPDGEPRINFNVPGGGGSNA